MGIKSDQGYIYFNELLYRCMRRKYGNMKINRKMQIFELRTQYRIYIMTREIQNKRSILGKDELYNGLIKKENGVNPFLTVMNFKISYRTWLKFAQDRLKKDALKNELSVSESSRRSLSKEKEIVMYPVDIEVEKYVQLTSEEEDFFDDSCEINQYCRVH